jgi:SAM-dependent methyltransferase
MNEPPVSPAAERNKGPILEVLRALFPPEGAVLEIACGTAQHAAHFAQALPSLEFYPTDGDVEMLSHASARVAQAALSNLHAPARLDVHDRPWALAFTPRVVYCANMIHIAPPSAMEALLRGAGEALEQDGKLVLYGPFRFEGEPLAESNLAFESMLKEKDPRFGIRSLEELRAIAAPSGLVFDRRVAMPANNHILVFRRIAG